DLAKIYGRFEAKERDVSSVVKEIIEDVKKNKNKALFKYTKKFDNADYDRKSVLVSKEEIKKALKRVKKSDLALLEEIAGRIRKFHQKQLKNSWFTNDEPGIVLGQMVNPLNRVGLYVPGGKAAYPSSVIMNAIPAKIAGVNEVIMVCPTPNGHLNDIIVAAAVISGVDKVFKVGGAQAVAALAYGTASIPKVDKIVGPGNMYVAEAKRMLYGVVDIDMVAGPSEILIISDGTKDPAYAAADMLSQAEHDEMACSYLVTHDEKHAKAVIAELKKQLKKLKRSKIALKSLEDHGAVIITKSLKESIDIANKIASEHLELAVNEPFSILSEIKNAGAIFMGAETPEAIGDYAAGPNHVLPTGGTARFYSPLSVDDFIKRSSIIYYTKDALKDMGESAARMADLEGLTAHANAVRIRLKK
ncbi:histidinol dehydrogenase, partial [Thermodesulfobacteriota bacterium]